MRLEYRSIDLLAAAATNFPAARRALQSLPSQKFASINDSDFADGFGLVDFWEPARYFEIEWRTLVQRRLVATSLAAQLFRLDHSHWPQTLGELVPDYLPSVPIDAIQGDDMPLGYWLIPASSAGPERPIIYMGSPRFNHTPPPTASYEIEMQGFQWLDISKYAPNPPATTTAQSPSSK